MWTTLIPFSLFYKYPPDEWLCVFPLVNRKIAQHSLQFKPLEMLKTYQWYLMYLSFAFTISVVLTFGAQMKMLAAEFNMPQRYFNFLLVLFPLGNGFSRIIAGAVSDSIGREKTMMIFFVLLGLSIYILSIFGYVPAIFITAISIASLLGGSPFVLYPATIGDYYGAKYATANYGITITAKAWAGLISGWLSGFLVTEFGSYKIPLVMLSIFSLVAGLVASPKLLMPPNKY